MPLMVLVGGPGSGATGMALRLAARREAAGQQVVFAADGGEAPDAYVGRRASRIAKSEMARAAWPSRIDGEAFLVVCSLASAMGEAGAAGEQVVEGLARRSGDTVVVAEPAGGHAAGEGTDAREARERLGQATARLARLADASYAVVAGHALELTGLPTDIDWLED